MIGLLNRILNNHSRIRVRIDEEVCSGCGKCVKICPQVFAMEERLAVRLTHVDPAQFKKACKKAAEACSVEAVIIE